MGWFRKTKQEYLCKCIILRRPMKYQYLENISYEYTVKTPDGYLLFGTNDGSSLRVSWELHFTYYSLKEAEEVLKKHINELYPEYRPVENVHIDMNKF